MVPIQLIQSTQSNAYHQHQNDKLAAAWIDFSLHGMLNSTYLSEALTGGKGAWKPMKTS